jgi:TetR/AcrR family transcriptional regulator
MTSANVDPVTWDERVAARSPSVERARLRTVRQARMMLDAAKRLMGQKGDDFTIQELAKEAGVALQTFYNYFTSKDELLLAMIGDLLTESCARWAAAARDLPDPLTRLHFYITSTFDTLDGGGQNVTAAAFIATTHWRLHRIFPNELAAAQLPFVELLRGEIRASIDAGLLPPIDPYWDGWFLNELIRSVYHHYAYTAERTPEVREELWRFCLRAIGGTVDVRGTLTDRPEDVAPQSGGQP